MNAELLIDAVVRQTTILIAQLATSGGARTPLADVANFSVKNPEPFTRPLVFGSTNWYVAQGGGM